jgi:hypothetical protein
VLFGSAATLLPGKIKSSKTIIVAAAGQAVLLNALCNIKLSNQL